MSNSIEERCVEIRKQFAEAQVGWWYSVCCCEDCYKVEDGNELQDLRKDMEEIISEDVDDVDLVMCGRFFPTKESAKAALCGCEKDEECPLDKCL